MNETKLTPKTKKDLNSSAGVKTTPYIPEQRATLSIVQKVSGEELPNVMEGIKAFSTCFDKDVKYELSVRLEKVIEGD